MTIKRICMPIVGLIACGVLMQSSWAQAVGSATVRVVTEPEFSDVTVGFSGTPSGQLELGNDGTGLLSTAVEPGMHVSSLASLDADLIGAGYQLADIRCDDGTSAQPSIGSVLDSEAAFNVDPDEAVICTFYLQRESASCTCPEEGRWRVNNHAGSMVCSGAMSMTQPLRPSSGAGTITPNSDCTSVLAEGMSDDEANITMAVQPDCSWVGTVGGVQDGIPMTITFTWSVADEETITGDLYSEVSQQGVTCEMSRTYDLSFDG